MTWAGGAGDDDRIGDYTIRVRRDLHAFPELGLRNPVTQRYVLDELEAVGGLELHRGVRSTAVVARLATGRPGRTVLLRADTDALPVPDESGEPFASSVEGVSHSCGHDAHVAMLLGAVRLLAARRDTLCGEVVFAFQAGEEGHDGARELLADQAFEGLLGPDDIDRAFALHITPNLPSGTVASRPGTVMASTDGLSVTVRGRGGHAALPQLSVNPVPALVEVAGGLMARFTATERTLLTLTGLRAGTAHNVIPDTAQLSLSLRCLDEESRLAALEWLRTDGLAVAGEATAELSSLVSYPCTVNDPGAVDTVRAAAGALGLPWLELPEPVMASEDFSYFLQRWPGCMSLLGACPAGVVDPATAAPCHAAQMRIDEAVLERGARLNAELAASVCGAVVAPGR